MTLIAAPSRQPLWGGVVTSSATLTDILGMFGEADWSENWQSTIIPTAGVMKFLCARLSASVGSGDTRTFTVWKGTVASPTAAIVWASTSLAITFANPSFQEEDIVNSVSVAAGDFLQIRETTTGAPTTTFIHFGCLFVPTVNQKTILSGWTGTTQLSTATELMPMCGAQNPHTTGNGRMYFPTSGTVRDLYAHLSTSPRSIVSDPEKTRTFDVLLNGATVGGGAGGPLSVTLGSTTRSGSNLSNSFSVVDGDYIQLKCTTALTPRASYLSAGVVFIPDNDHEFITQATQDFFMPEVNQTMTHLNLGGRQSLVTTTDLTKGFLSHQVQLMYSRHHRTKTLVSAKSRRYNITQSGSHQFLVNASSPKDMTDNTPQIEINHFATISPTSMREFLVANNVPSSFKNTWQSTTLWKWVDTGSDEVNFF